LAELRSPTVRVALGIAILLLGGLELASLVLTLRSHARLRDRIAEIAVRSLAVNRPRLQRTLATGGAGAARAAAEEAYQLGLADEVDVFDASGRLLVSHPVSSPVTPEDDAANRATALRDGLVVRGPVLADVSRLFTYAAFNSSEGPVVLRLASSAGEMVDDLRDRRSLYAGHALTLALLLLAGALVLYPSRERPAREPAAFAPFQEAIQRLRSRDEQRAREHEAELAQLAEQLRDKETLARAGELTAGIAHEVRNGLATILGYARLLEQGADAEQTQAAVRAIRGECDLLEGVIRRFLELCKDDALHAARLDLERLLSRVCGRESRQREGARVGVEGGATEIDGDEALLERAFENLVRNAREAAGDSGEVRVRVGRDREWAVVSIEDDGPGLPPELRGQPRLFVTTKKGGLGLGLAIAFKMVQLHGGSLSLRGRPEGGVEALVRLPASRPEEPPDAT